MVLMGPIQLRIFSEQHVFKSKHTSGFNWAELLCIYLPC